MAVIVHNLTKAEKRKRRVRGKISGTSERPRVTVNRSNKFVYLQAIDDTAGKTIAAAHDKQIRAKSKKKSITKEEAAKLSAESLADQLKKKKIKAVVFDRGQYKYHGRVKATAEALREKGINV